MEASERIRRSLTCHSSWISASTAPARRSSAAGLGKTPTTSVRRLISLLTRSRPLVPQIFFQCSAGKVRERGELVTGVAQHGLDLGELAAEHPGDGVELGADAGRARLGEDGAHGGGDHVGVALGHGGGQVAGEMKP
jgi:hypothetical protein